MNKQELIDELARHASCLEDFRGITGHCDGKYEAYEIAIELTKQLDEPQKPVVPKFLDEYMKENEGKHAADIFSTEWLYEEPNVLEEKVAKWLLNDETEENNRRYLIAVQAFVTGDYEVEKEPLYYVKIPSLAYDMFLVKGEDGELIVFQNTSCGTKFTEAEIKAIDERYWAFAVPVEEVAEG